MSRVRSLLVASAVAFAVATAASGCVRARYAVQAGFGQLDLWQRARPRAEVIADPDTDPATRALLIEVDRVLAFARASGLATRGNYDRYVPIAGEGVVWFVTACRPLAFEPKLWRFPLVGSFPYLGWFDQRDAIAFARRLERAGWEVYVRPVAAYSTGGWLRDPVLSTMLDPGRGVRGLANTLLHELVHANVLVPDQSVFNESVATFVADAMTADYLAQRFGAASDELAQYRRELADERRAGERLRRAVADLDAVYRSDAPEAVKRRRKRRLLRALAADLGWGEPPNNAYLMQFRTYHAGFAALARLRRACGAWPRVLEALRAVTPRDFPAPQHEPIDAAVAAAIGRCRAD